MKDQPHDIAYDVAHSMKGRIRIRIPELRANSNYGTRLEQLIAICGGKANSQIYTRINADAYSIVITYDPKGISEEVLRLQLHQAIQQAGSIIPASTLPPETSAPSDSIPSEIDIQDQVLDGGVPGMSSCLSQRALAKRLGSSVASLRQRRSLPDFPIWSGAKDPEGTAWKYETESGYFYPISPETLSSLNQDCSTQP